MAGGDGMRRWQTGVAGGYDRWQPSLLPAALLWWQGGWGRHCDHGGDQVEQWQQQQQVEWQVEWQLEWQVEGHGQRPGTPWHWRTAESPVDTEDWGELLTGRTGGQRDWGDWRGLETGEDWRLGVETVDWGLAPAED